MAKSLNKSRMQNSRIVIAGALAVVLFTSALIPPEMALHETLDYLGAILLAVCGLGRVYATAFLGGHKNETLITHGAFSVVRNPLYFFSLLGMTGIALVSGHIVLMVIIPVFFLVLYHYLIKREESFLLEKFGQTYADYMKSTPRLFPNINLYRAPDTVEMVPKYLNKAFKDAIWWFAVFPIFEFIEYLHRSAYIKPLFMVP